MMKMRALSINTVRTVKLLNETQNVWALDLSDVKIVYVNRMRSIFARYLRNIDQIFSLIQKQKFGSDRSGH
jgi:hypothetical protein